jgi:hypothetical protein
MIANMISGTQATDQDFYLGSFPSLDPFVLRYLELLKEAERVRRLLERWHVGNVKSEEEAWVEAGNLINDLVSNSKELVGPHKDQYWDGCRKCAALPRAELVKMVTAFEHYKIVYQVQKEWTTNWISKVRSELEDRANTAMGLDILKSIAIRGVLGAVGGGSLRTG